MHQPFVYQLVPTLVQVMGQDFPEIKSSASVVADTIKTEEENFGRTLDRGIDLFEQVAQRIAREGQTVFPGDDAFKLYDTYGFPLDLTELMARERALSVDQTTFNELMQQQRTRARAAAKTVTIAADSQLANDLPETDDSAKYDPQMTCQARLLGYLTDDQWQTSGQLDTNRQASLVADRTCFYAESGGQVGDKGMIVGPTGRFIVEDTLKVGRAVAHRGKVLEGTFAADQTVELQVDRQTRQSTMNNHTATHILQWALREVLGEHVRQEGSLVCDEYLRFDFMHNKAMTKEQLEKVQQLVCEKIDQQLTVTCRVMSIEEGHKLGVIALFGEKYGQTVRVVAIGAKNGDHLQDAFSKEFCGGTHVENVGSIGDLLITREESISAGVRRITACTGRALRELLHQRYKLAEQLGQVLKVPPEQIRQRIEALQEENRKLKKQLKQGAAVDLTGAVKQLFDKAQQIGPATVIVGQLPQAPVQKIREQMDWLRKKVPTNLVAVLGCGDDQKVQLIATVADELIKSAKLSAKELIHEISSIVGGGGGGRDQLAQAGGKLPEKLPEALDRALQFIREKLS